MVEASDCRVALISLSYSSSTIFIEPSDFVWSDIDVEAYSDNNANALYSGLSDSEISVELVSGCWVY